MSHINGTAQNFQSEVIDYQGLVLVDFWATWCGPCQMLTPIIEEIGKDLEGRLKVVKIDVDNESGLAEKYNIHSIPVVIIFDKGQIKDTIVGFHQKQDYLAALGV